MNVKRLFDLAIALALLAVLALPMLLIGLFIRLGSKGPAFHVSQRIGRDNKPFSMYKFRTMTKNAPVVATHLMTEAERYVTPIGSFLRNTSLDEVPQLLNIIKGEMSLVGPRPALFNQADLIAMRTEIGVHHLVPGLTGWAQVNGRDELPIPKKVELDHYYLENRNFLFDIKIIFLTFYKVLKEEGVSH
jgi:O-antigen biosynthesis protein WbqP